MVNRIVDILVAGEINPDLILTGTANPEYGQVEQIIGGADLTIGSSSVIFACGAARLGLRVKFVGICGDDIFGHFMLDAMENRGVDISSIIIDPQSQTGISVILNRKIDRAILTHIGSMASLRVTQVTDQLLETSKHLHVASYFLQEGLRPGLPDLFRRARQLDLTTSLDTNWDPSQLWLGVRDVLKFTTIFMPNAAEVCAISGIPETEKAAASLGSLTQIIAVKLGDQGALGIQKDKIISVPAIPMNVVDTVGAGDSFDAGFIYGYLNGWDLERSLQLGVVCGGLSTQGAGGTAAQPTLQQALGRLASKS